MKPQEPFRRPELDELAQFLDRAAAVVAMCDVHAGVTDPDIVAMRHDVDNYIEPAVAFARWEAEHGYTSTYYLLHTAPYWQDKYLLRTSLFAIADAGHEIGLHNNALAHAVVTGQDPRLTLEAAVAELRGYGYEVRGTVAHGDPNCYGPDGNVRFVNDEIFTDCPRPGLGDADRIEAGVQLDPKPLHVYGFDYDANWLSRGAYLSDSGGRWSGAGFDAISTAFPFGGQLHMLVHPDWWREAFSA